ncbi:MAG: hypothetical protein A3Q59_01970 [Methanomethylophilus alvi]|nr:MAG: hypothetical protein A3Q59_01970 [Methanomethylophilus alvi]
MRRSFVLPALLAALLLFPSALFSDTAEGASVQAFRIEAADPSGEGFEIANIGGSEASLSGWSITDGEGTLTFSDIRIPFGSSKAFCKDPDSCRLVSTNGFISYSEAGTRKGSLVLADGGDELVLMHGDVTADSVCWGSSKGASGWSGDPVTCPSGHYLKRISGYDTDTASDWKAAKPGWTEFTFPGNGPYEADVTPFSFPESGGEPVYRLLESASRTADICIYLISCPNTIALLAQLQSRGVSVRILAEAEPLGTDISTEISLLESLRRTGADVRLINHGDAAQRYMYVHSKYAVIDGEKTVITSENWTSGNMGFGNGNRGWGAVIDSTEYASCMEEAFENDFSSDWGDTVTLASAYPDAKPYRGDLSYQPPEDAPRESFRSLVYPIFSPDDSFSAMKELMGSAEERIYAEEMDLGSSLRTVSGDSPVSWMSAAAIRGVETRFILDASTSSGDAETFVNLMNQTTKVRAKAVDGGPGFSLIHNKGVVIDGGVWVGSVNWTENSFLRNRETAAFIVSESVSDFFAGLFMSDYGMDTEDLEENGLNLTADVVDTGGGRHSVVLRTSGPEGAVYIWNIDGDIRKSEHPSAMFGISPGHHTAAVTLEGTDTTQTAEFDVPSESGLSEYIIYLTAASVILIGAAAAFLHGRRGNRGWRYGGQGPGNLNAYTRW